MLIFDGNPRSKIFRDDGVEICLNDEHPLKTKYPNEVTDEGIEICVNDEHPLKA